MLSRTQGGGRLAWQASAPSDPHGKAGKGRERSSPCGRQTAESVGEATVSVDTFGAVYGYRRSFVYVPHFDFRLKL